MTNIKGFTNTQKIKEEAANWLLIVEQESPLSPQKIQALQDWIDTSDVHRAVIKRMSQTWNSMDLLSAMRVTTEQKSRFSIGAIKVFLGGRILRALSKQDKKPVVARYPLFFGINIVLVCFIVSFLVFNTVNNKSETSEPQYYATEIGEYAKHTLEDGSTLWLNSNSKVKVNYNKAFRRIALIEGEAHFKVTKDASRPFEVYSMNRLVRAIGTEFSVHKLKDSVEVMVSEGSVQLAIVDEMLILKPDDLMTYNKAGAQKVDGQKSIEMSNKPATISKFLGKLSAGDSMSIPVVTSARIDGDNTQVVRLDEGEVGRKLSWLDGKLVFAGESLAQVVTEISRHTTIKIDVPDPELRKIRIGGHFEAGETDKLFTILESGFGIEVNKIDDHHVQLLLKK